MTTIYSARWVVPVSAAPIKNGAVAVEGQRIAGVGPRAEIVEQFPESRIESFGEAIQLSVEHFGTLDDVPSPASDLVIAG